MAKRKSQRKKETALTHKQLARSRVEKKERRNIFIAVGVIAAIVVIIMLVGLVSELIIKPGQPVARVDGVEITTAQFQERVRFERARTIDLIEEYADLFGVEQVYGIAGQLNEYETIGEQVLDGMVDEILVRQSAADLGFQVSDDEVTQLLEEQEGYYRYGTPTPLPSRTPFPTPTPISPTETVPTPLPTPTLRPIPTAVTQNAFEDAYRGQLRLFRRANVGEDVYRAAVELQLLTNQVREYLAQDLPLEAEQVDLDMLYFATEEEANVYLARLEAGESFEILLDEARADAEDGVSSRTFLWTPYDELAEQVGSMVATLAFTLEVAEYSRVIEMEDGQFALLQITGHEERELSASILNRQEDQAYTTWLEGLREAAEIEKYEYWVNRVPRTPALDPQKLVPTPTPET